MRMIATIILSLMMSGAAMAATPCEPRKAVAPGLARLQTAMTNNRFIAYNPTGLKVIDGNVTVATPESIRADLKVLRPHFDALITYSARDGNEQRGQNGAQASQACCRPVARQ